MEEYELERNFVVAAVEWAVVVDASEDERVLERNGNLGVVEKVDYAV